MKPLAVCNYFGLVVVLCIPQELYALNNELPESSDELIFAHIVSKCHSNPRSFCVNKK